MCSTIIYVALVAAILIYDPIYAKRTRNNKRGKIDNDIEETTPQPSVVSYSTFGFNDVGGYDGFVPTSPDYASYLSSFNKESPTRLYAPAFPTAQDDVVYNGNPEQQPEAPLYNPDDGNIPQESVVQYPKSPYFYNSQIENNQPKSTGTDEVYEKNIDKNNSPIYGTKIGSRERNKPLNPYNETGFDRPLNVYDDALNVNQDHAGFKIPQPSYDDKTVLNGESSSQSHTYQNFYSHPQNYPPTTNNNNNNNWAKPVINNSVSTLKFPKVIDFTKYKQDYPTELDNKYMPQDHGQNPFNPSLSTPNENVPKNNADSNGNRFSNPTPVFKDMSPQTPFQFENEYENEVKNNDLYSKPDPFQNNDNIAPIKKDERDAKPNVDYKRFRQYAMNNFGNDYKNAKSPMKGYEYSTNFSNISFAFDFGAPKNPFNDSIDEIVPASSNIINTNSYRFPDTDFTSSFKKLPEFKPNYEEEQEISYPSFKSKYNKKPDEYLNQFKNLYSSAPTATSQWGNRYKSADLSYKHHFKGTQYGDDDVKDDIVHIPKQRPYRQKYNFDKYLDPTPTDWSSFSSKKRKPVSDWKDLSNNRFKSEEDLLGLRTLDTSQASYLPTYKPNYNTLDDEIDYKKIVDKWRQSYLKSKYKDSLREYDSYASDLKPHHVPIPKPYAIEVPHPVVVPVPQPYPVRVPIPKPVAIPYVQEITVPIEKPVPYPVVKNVPYPVEKLVPVHVEKKVPVPVAKPYPVHVPHVRPIFHHSRPSLDDIDSDHEDDDYMPRPETGRIPYAKRPKTSTRQRPRRPTRTYHDRNRRRWPAKRPEGRPISFSRDQKHGRTSQGYKPHSYTYQEDEYEREPSDYQVYCKRTGNC